MMRITFLTSFLLILFSFAGNDVQAKSLAKHEYWSDLLSLCRKYSGATHPPCEKSNGAKVILEHVVKNCSGDNACLNEMAGICRQYSGATHPPCNVSNGAQIMAEHIEQNAPVMKEKRGSPNGDKYWADVVSLCRIYSGATHPPCEKTNGAKLILDHVRENCQKSKPCLQKAVKICKQYSSGTHPPCHASNGINVVTEEIERAAESYPLALKSDARDVGNSVRISSEGDSGPADVVPAE